MAIIENEKLKNGRIKPGKLILHRCRGPPFVRSKKNPGGNLRIDRFCMDGYRRQSV